ncbi:hypothetical protein DD557_11935 [Thalassobacter stenotrophicus]|nr:hypothetical protein DD557_11935 [Thalassobacter stenotrophicus]
MVFSRLHSFCTYLLKIYKTGQRYLHFHAVNRVLQVRQPVEQMSVLLPRGILPASRELLKPIGNRREVTMISTSVLIVFLLFSFGLVLWAEQ